jgi:hypothetical protein
VRSTSWVDRIQPYVAAWVTAAAPENVVTEDRPHDDRVWEADIQWCTLEDSDARDVRSTAATNAVSGCGEDPSFCHLPGATGSTLRLDNEFENCN